MINAELLNNTLLPHPSEHGYEVRIAHIKTRYGTATVKSVLPSKAQEDIFVSGGLLSGANYPRFINRAAQRGFNSRTIRHGNNSIHGAIEADAEEFAAAIELLADDRPIHIVAHSKGARVAIKAVALLDPGIMVRGVKLVNPALERTPLTVSSESVLGAMFEQVACLGRIRHGARGVWHELTHRGLGVIGEVHDLIFNDGGLDTEMEALADRGIEPEIWGGSFDHIVPQASTAAAIQRLRLTRVETARGRIDGSHFGILASDRVVDFIMPQAIAS